MRFKLPAPPQGNTGLTKSARRLDVIVVYKVDRLTRSLADAVQALQSQQRNNHETARRPSNAKLSGLIYDTKATNDSGGIKEEWQDLSLLYLVGIAPRQAEEAGSITRIPADQIELFVQKAIDAKAATALRLHRIEISAAKIRIELIAEVADESEAERITLSIPWKKRPVKMAREIVPPLGIGVRSEQRSIRSQNRTRLVEAISRGRHWLRQLRDAEVTSVDQIAKREKCSVRQVNRLLTLAFLSPQIVEAAVSGRLPRGVGIASIRELPAEWAEQHKALGPAF